MPYGAAMPADLEISSDGNRPLRVLHLTEASEAGGISRYLFDLNTAMAERGHRVAVAGGRGVWHGLFEQAAFPWVDVSLSGGPVRLWRAARQLRAWCGDDVPDVLHAHYRRSVIAGRMLQRRWRRAGKRVPPLLYTLHLTGVPLGGVRGWLSDFGDHTHVPSAAALRWTVDAAGVDAERVTLIPHGIDRRRFPPATEADRAAARAELGLDDDATVAAFVGRFDDPKNEGWVLDVAAAARDRVPGARFVLAGGGPHEAALRERIALEGLDDRVTVLGYGEPLAVYRACDVLLLPSSLEGFGLVCAEAMSVGRAVLRTATAGAEETVEPGVTGSVVPIDRAAFVDEALRLLGDRASLRAVGEAAGRRVGEHLGVERQLADTMALYRRLAGGEPGGRP